jgi:HK97 family phage prohead protease
MPQLLKPSDVAQRLKAGETPEAIFGAPGARTAKAIGVEASIAAADAERSVDFAISTGALDRYNSTIAVKGWQLANYSKNSVVLWAHDDSIPAIARAETTRIDGDRLRSRAVFADRDTHPLADTIFRLVKAKFINAASVGWIPLKWQFVDEEGRGFGIDYLEQELLEWSVVNIPANPECLVEARSFGIDTSPLMVWAERALDQGGMSVIPRAELEALRRAAGAPTVARPIRLKFEPIGVDDTVEQILRVRDAIDAIVENRTGRVLSKENEDKLAAAHDHLQACGDKLAACADHCRTAAEHVRAVIEANHKPEVDPDHDPENPDDDDPEQAAARERQRQTARVLKLKGGAAA